MLGWFVALIVFFALGLALGAAVTWWYLQRETATPPDAAPVASPSPAPSADIAPKGLHVLWDPTAQHKVRVHFHGKAYPRSWDLPDDLRYEFQRYLHRLIRWFDHPEGTASEAEKPAAERPARPRLSPAAVVGMYEEIDQVLQSLLQQRGLPYKVSLRYAADVMQLFIHVDAERYEHVDDIPNAEIRELIREAARLWEQRR